MTEKENVAIDRITALVDRILAGNNSKKVNTECIEQSDNPAIDELAGKITFLEQQLNENYRFIMDLSRGKLNTEPASRNAFVGSYKQLHSELRYLTWQIQQIADGDYDQRVSFSGDFSEAINKMILALRERQTLVDLIKENEKQLQKTASELDESNKTKDRLLSIIAHDLKNPFNAIVGFSEISLQEIKAGNSEQIEVFIQAIYNSASQGYALLINLLEWSRLQSGRIVISPQLIDLKYAILNNIKIASLSALAKNITLELVGDEDQYPVNTDNAIVNTVLRNLISNAIKYTYPDGKILVSIKKSPDHLLVSVKDNGVGIKEEDLQELFKVDNIRSTSGTGNEEGTGLGLALCHDFIHKVGGEIWVESTYGQGSTFTFSVPDII